MPTCRLREAYELATQQVVDVGIDDRLELGSELNLPQVQAHILFFKHREAAAGQLYKEFPAASCTVLLKSEAPSSSACFV